MADKDINRRTLPGLRGNGPMATHSDAILDYTLGRSLCHAWPASPIYLPARYFAGLETTGPVKEEYELHPHLEYFDSLDCVLPAGAK